MALNFLILKCLVSDSRIATHILKENTLFIFLKVTNYHKWFMIFQHIFFEILNTDFAD